MTKLKPISTIKQKVLTKKNNTISTKFRQNLPCTGRFPKPAKESRLDGQQHIYDTKATHPHFGQISRCSVGSGAGR
jgi:hypothetical protein